MRTRSRFSDHPSSRLTSARTNDGLCEAVWIVNPFGSFSSATVTIGSNVACITLPVRNVCSKM